MAKSKKKTSRPIDEVELTEAEAAKLAAYEAEHPGDVEGLDIHRSFLIWRRDNPIATYDHEAFGTTWKAPAELAYSTHLLTLEIQEDGRTLDEMTADELASFVRSVLGADLFVEWTATGVSLPTMLREVGKVYMYQRGVRDTAKAA